MRYKTYKTQRGIHTRKGKKNKENWWRQLIGQIFFRIRHCSTWEWIESNEQRHNEINVIKSLSRSFRANYVCGVPYKGHIFKILIIFQLCIDFKCKPYTHIRYDHTTFYRIQHWSQCNDSIHFVYLNSVQWYKLHIQQILKISITHLCLRSGRDLVLFLSKTCINAARDLLLGIFKVNRIGIVNSVKII